MQSMPSNSHVDENDEICRADEKDLRAGENRKACGYDAAAVVVASDGDCGLCNEQACASDADARSAWGFDDLKKGLGVTRDVVTIGRAGTDIGFNIAEKATKFGFGIARGTLQGIGLIPGLGRAMSVTDSVVGFAQDITEGSQAFARGVTLASLDVTAAGLDAAGAEKYELAKQIIGEDEVAACIEVTRLAGKLNEGSQISSLSSSNVLDGLAAIAATQLNSVPHQSSLAPEDVEQYARLLWLSGAMYGQRMNQSLGLFRNVRVVKETRCASDGGVHAKAEFCKLFGEAEWLEAAVETRAISFLEAAAASCDYTLIEDHTAACAKQMYLPAYAIFGTSGGDVVVAVRGTSNFRDALIDLVCDPLPLEVGELKIGDEDVEYVHEGMWRSAQKLVELLQSSVFALLDRKENSRLIITGHSLGAGVASLLCLLWRPLLGERVSCVTFAPPQTLDERSAMLSGAHGVSAMIVGDDVVPRLSLRTATNFAAELVRLSGNEDTSEESDWKTIIENNRAPELRPAGTLFHFDVPGGRRGSAAHSDFDRIRVSRSMLTAHMQVSYLKALGQL